MSITPAQTLQAFAFDSHAVRVVHIANEPWFVAADVCAALSLGNTSMALDRLDDDEQTLSSIEGIHSGAGNPNVKVINESGLYSLILGSRKPEAKKFKKWVTSEVLPAIRKTGQYSAPGVPQAASDARVDKLIGLVEQMLSVLPTLVQGQRAPLPKRKPASKPMQLADANRILALRAKGYVLDELISETGFSQSQCWAVIRGQYKVLESGRVSIYTQSVSARAADAAAKFERANPLQRPLV